MKENDFDIILTGIDAGNGTCFSEPQNLNNQRKLSVFLFVWITITIKLTDYIC